jgi:hypothetical protein
MQILSNPVPGLEVVVWLESLSSSRSQIDWLPSPNSLRVTVVEDGLLSRVDNSALIVSVADPTVSNPSAIVANAKRSFQSADADMNGYLELREVSGNRFFQGRFESMDRDGDGKVYEEEMLFIVEQQAAIQASRVFATVADTGRNIFQMVDPNRDGRVSGSELAEAARLFPLWDHDGDGAVVLRDIPRGWRLTISRGQPPADVGVPASARGVLRPGPLGEPSPLPARGPVWFHRMDRNQDGRVTRREFLFDARHFEALDSNHDGVVELSEAEAAPMQ